MKPCSKCKNEKHTTEFYRDSKAKDGLTSSCRQCHREWHDKNREKILTKKKEYYDANKSRLNEQTRIKRAENNEKFIKKEREYRRKNKEKKAMSDKKYYEKSKEKIFSRQKRYYKLKRDDASIAYCKKLIVGTKKISLDRIPNELAECKKIQLLITRELRRQV